MTASSTPFIDNASGHNSHAVTLEAVEPEDVDFMLECESDGEASHWSDYRAPLSRTQLLSYALTYDADPFSAGQLRLIIKNKEGVRVGIIDLYDISEKDGRAFVGIMIHPSFRNSGYAKSALSALADFASERMGLHQLVAKVAELNPRALSLFRNAGYQTIALLPDWHRIGNSFHSFHLLSLNLLTS